MTLRPFFSDTYIVFRFVCKHNSRRKTKRRRGGRAVECTGLENQQGFVALRGFESLPLRQLIKMGPCGPFLIYKQGVEDEDPVRPTPQRSCQLARQRRRRKSIPPSPPVNQSGPLRPIFDLHAEGQGPSFESLIQKNRRNLGIVDSALSGHCYAQRRRCFRCRRDSNLPT